MNTPTNAFASPPPLPRKALKIDSRGRVRFTSQGKRFEITKNGLNVYERSAFMNMTNEVQVFFPVNRLTSKTLKLIVEAVNLVNA